MSNITDNITITRDELMWKSLEGRLGRELTLEECVVTAYALDWADENPKESETKLHKGMWREIEEPRQTTCGIDCKL